MKFSHEFLIGSVVFSLRDGIKENPSQWRNCTMFVQDIKSPGVNITVDVPEIEAEQFKEMCRTFRSANVMERTMDEYLLKVSKNRPECVVDLTADNDGDETPPAKRAALDIPSIGGWNINAQAHTVDFARITDDTHLLINVIMSNKTSIFQDIPSIAIELMSRTARRISDERDILACLKRHFNTCSNQVQTIPFGSSTYGFGSAETDFNILVNIGKTIRTILNQFGFVHF